MVKPSQSALVSPQQTVELQGWEKEVFSEFKDRMLAEKTPFPCIFGVEAVSRGTLRYGFNQNPLDTQATALSTMLKEFTEIAPSLGKRTSLVVFFKSLPDNLDHESLFEWFWTLLQETTMFDGASWPKDVSSKPDESTFEWSFNGQPMFVVVNTPLHNNRRSRQFSTVAVTFQPRFVFDDIAEGSERGDAARKVIRARLKEYDSTPITPFLGSYGDKENREWIQYYLDDGEPMEKLNRCPIHDFQER